MSDIATWCLYYMWRDTDGLNVHIVGEDGLIIVDAKTKIKETDVVKRFPNRREAYEFRNDMCIDDHEIDGINDDYADLRVTTIFNLMEWIKEIL